MMLNVMQELIDHQLDDILTTILLYLDPASLQSAGQVCWAWHDTIYQLIWDRRYTRDMVQRAHLQNWLQGHYEAKRLQTFSGADVYIYSLCCDEYRIVAGLSNGLAKVFNIKTMVFMYLLNCRRGCDIGQECSYGVRTAIGEEVIVCGTSDGVLAVWDKRTFALLYKTVRGKITSVKAVGSLILAVDTDKVFILKYVKQSEQVEMVTSFHDFGSGAMTKVDCDEEWVLVGTSRKILLFSLETCECVLSLPTGHINSVALRYPFCLAVGAGCGGGVWDLTTGALVKTFGDKTYWDLHYNARFLIASEMNCKLRKFKRVPGNFPPLHVTMFDMKDLTRVSVSEDLFASNINPDAVWNRQFSLPTQYAARGTEYCCAALNINTMVQSQSDHIFVLNFAIKYV